MCTQAKKDQEARAAAAAAEATAFELQEGLAEVEAALHASKAEKV